MCQFYLAMQRRQLRMIAKTVKEIEIIGQKSGDHTADNVAEFTDSVVKKRFLEMERYIDVCEQENNIKASLQALNSHFCQPLPQTFGNGKRKIRGLGHD